MNPYLLVEISTCAISCACTWFGTGKVYQFGKTGIYATIALALMVIFHAPY